MCGVYLPPSTTVALVEVFDVNPVGVSTRFVLLFFLTLSCPDSDR